MVAVTRIAVVDEHPLFAEGVLNVLKNSGRFEVVAIGASADQAVAIAREKRPDLMIVEINLPGGGLEAARRVTTESPSTKIVFLTSSETDEHVSTALRDGARGYVLKGIDKSEFVKIIAEIESGRFYVNPTIAARMLGRTRAPAAGVTDGVLSELTVREREIITHVAQGMTNKEVASSLRLGEKTVKHHMTSIMQKLQVRNRLEAVLLVKEKLGGGVAPAPSAASAPLRRPIATSMQSGLISSQHKIESLFELDLAHAQRRR